MKKIDRDLILALASDVKLRLTEIEIADILAERETFASMMAHLDAVDTEGIEPMIYPFSTPQSYLRKDEVSHVLSQADVMKNAPQTKDDYFEIVKVID